MSIPYVFASVGTTRIKDHQSIPLSGVYTANLFTDQLFSQTFCFIDGQYLAQIKFQIGKQIGCVDAALDQSSLKRPILF